MKNILLGLLLLTYPFIVYFGLSYFEPSILAVIVGLLCLLRHFSQPLNAQKQRGKIPHLNILLMGVLSLFAYTSLTNSELALKFYPVVVNLSFLIIFAYSLFKPPSVIEIFARLQLKKTQYDINQENINIHNDELVKYTRKVTIIWCAFFIINAIIASWTIFHSDPQYWLIYNGMISYIFMGILIVVELVYRKFIRTNNSTNQSTRQL